MTTIPRDTVNPQFDPEFPALVDRLGRELLSLAAVWYDLDVEDRQIARRSVADAADCLIPAIQAMRHSAPAVCVETTVEVHASCHHPQPVVTT